MKTAFRIIIGVVFLGLLAIAYMWWTDMAVSERVVIQREVVTSIDTVTVEVIETMWREIMKEVVDTLYLIKPDTIYVVEDYSPSMPWQERIERLVYNPPTLTFVASAGDTAARRIVYSTIPWGFIVQPDNLGLMLVQTVESPPPPAIRYGYNWGLGASWENGVTPSIFGEYNIGWRGITITGLMQVSAVGANAGVYARWR